MPAAQQLSLPVASTPKGRPGLPDELRGLLIGPPDLAALPWGGAGLLAELCPVYPELAALRAGWERNPSERAGLAIRWLADLALSPPVGLVRLVHRAALDGDPRAAGVLAQDPALSVTFVAELGAALGSLLAASGLSMGLLSDRVGLAALGCARAPDPDAPEEAELLAADVRAAGWFAGLGATGRALAAGLLGKARERARTQGAALWTWWAPLGVPDWPPVVEALALVMYRDRWTPRLLAEYARPVGVPLANLEPVARVLRAGLALDGDRVRCGVRVVARLDIPDLPVADLESLRAVLAQDIARLASVQAPRLLCHLVTEVNRRHLRGDPDPRRLDYAGWGELTAAVLAPFGLDAGPRQRRDVRQAAHALRSLVLPLPGGEGNLWALEERRGAVRFVLGTAIVPGNTQLLPQGHRRIVPLLPLTGPPPDAPPCDHAPAAVLQLWLLAELTRRSAELLTEGGILLPAARRVELAELSGLRPDALSGVLRWWGSGCDRPWLAELAPDRFTLTPGPALDFIRAGAEREARGAERGRLSAARRVKLRKGGAP